MSSARWNLKHSAGWPTSQRLVQPMRGSGAAKLLAGRFRRRGASLELELEDRGELGQLFLVRRL